MTKPNWKDAPEWAQWLAQDGDGMYWWYAEEPYPSYPDEQFPIGAWWETGNHEKAGDYPITMPWNETLELRPAVQP